MKIRWISTALGSLTAALILAGCSPEQSDNQTEQSDVKPAPATQQQPIHPALSRLDLDGGFILFADTSDVEQSVLDAIDQLFESVVQLGQPDPAEMAEGLEIVEKIKSAITWSGLISLDSFAMSTKKIDDDLTQSIGFIGFSENDADSALWRVLASEATELKGIGFAPEDAVYTINSTASLNELWKVLNEALIAYVPEEGQQQFAQQRAMAEMMIGMDLDELFGSIGNEMLVSLQLSDTRDCTIPIDGEMLSIPEPSLLIGLQTADTTVSDLILAKLTESQAPMSTNEYGGQTLFSLNIPLPMPFPLQPTLVQTDDYLLIGSSREVITRALESQAEGNGLVATELYGKLLADAPEKTSGIEFMSPRLMEAFMDVVKQASESEGEDFYPFFERFLIGDLANAYAGSFAIKDADGLYSQTRANFNSAELVGKTYFSAIAAAVAIPMTTGNKEIAMGTEGQAGCATISTALRVHWVEHENFEGIENPADLSVINPGDLDGMYFTEASYSLESLVDYQNYTITARGVGAATGIQVTLHMVDGETLWDM